MTHTLHKQRHTQTHTYPYMNALPDPDIYTKRIRQIHTLENNGRERELIYVSTIPLYVYVRVDVTFYEPKSWKDCCF